MALGEERHKNSFRHQRRDNDSRTSLIGSTNSNKPCGIKLFGLCFNFGSSRSKQIFHKTLVLVLTFIAYAAFHMGRRPLSIVKNVLNQNCTNPQDTSITTNSSDQDDPNVFDLSDNSPVSSGPQNKSCSWAPFDNDETAKTLLGILDSSFLLAYALSMFVSGIIAERTNLRYVITIGALFSGIGLIAFGLAYPYQIHSLPYFITIQILSGIFQSTGWPVVVTIIGNWFEPSKRGTIYGLWNSHTNFGNILGATIAGFFVTKDWGLSFIVPGLIMIAVALILFLFLAPTPPDVDLEPIETAHAGSSRSSIASSRGDEESSEEGNNSARSIEIQPKTGPNQHNQEAVSFMKALAIPGVVEYSLCLFFSKLVNYTFLYWLPKYITEATGSDSEDSAYLSTPFDIGGALGAIVAGYLSDRYRLNGTICETMLSLSIPALYLYQQYGALRNVYNISLQLLVGFLVNGPYCLITTSVSADLGNRIKSGRAMATVAAIIDGTGSIGAVLGPLLAGWISTPYGWSSVFIMLMASDLLAAVCLIRLTRNEFRQGRSTD